MEGREVGSAEAGAALLCRAASPGVVLLSARGLISFKRKYKMSTSFEVSFSRTRSLLHLWVCVPLTETSVDLGASQD